MHSLRLLLAAALICGGDRRRRANRAEPSPWGEPELFASPFFAGIQVREPLMYRPRFTTVNGTFAITGRFIDVEAPRGLYVLSI
jgi:hypothetical protein